MSFLVLCLGLLVTSDNLCGVEDRSVIARGEANTSADSGIGSTEEGDGQADNEGYLVPLKAGDVQVNGKTFTQENSADSVLLRSRFEDQERRSLRLSDAVHSSKFLCAGTAFWWKLHREIFTESFPVSFCEDPQLAWSFFLNQSLLVNEVSQVPKLNEIEVVDAGEMGVVLSIAPYRPCAFDPFLWVYRMLSSNGSALSVFAPVTGETIKQVSLFAHWKGDVSPAFELLKELLKEKRFEGILGYVRCKKSWGKKSRTWKVIRQIDFSLSAARSKLSEVNKAASSNPSFKKRFREGPLPLTPKDLNLNLVLSLRETRV